MTGRPAFRKPWEHGARAYHEADTFEALAEGMKRKRTATMVRMPLTVAGDLECSVCGRRLSEAYPLNPGEPKMVKDDTTATVTFYPKSKTVAAAHYYCGWGALINKVFEFGDLMTGRKPAKGATI